MGYDFPITIYRAQCTRVIDGDTVELYVDLGRRQYQLDRFRIHGIDTAELSSKDPVLRARAIEAKTKVTEWLKPGSPLGKDWALTIRMYKDPDNFGRWLAEILFFDSLDIEHDLGKDLIAAGLAVPYTR